MTLSFGGLFLVFFTVKMSEDISQVATDSSIPKACTSIKLMLVVSTIVGVKMLTMMPGLIDDFAEDEGVSDDIFRTIGNQAGLIAGVDAIFIVICNGICGLMHCNTIDDL